MHIGKAGFLGNGLFLMRNLTIIIGWATCIYSKILYDLFNEHILLCHFSFYYPRFNPELFGNADIIVVLS